MTRWRCRPYQPLLVDSVEGVLDPGRQQRLEQHLERCIDCRADLDALRGLPAMLQTSGTPDPGNAFWQQQRQAIGRAIRNLPEPRAGQRLGWLHDALQHSRWRYPIAASAALVVALAVYHIADRTPGSGTSSIAVQLAALDTESLLTLADLAEAMAPAAHDMTDVPPDEELLLAASDLVATQMVPPVPDESELSDADIQGMDELVGNI
jgi:hypothetical protein